MVFDITKYPGNYVMHCANIFEAKSFCAYMHSTGRRWGGGQSYLEINYWERYETETVYNFNDGCYGTLETYIRQRYVILEWKDFMYDTPAGSVDDINIYDLNIISIAGYEFIRFPEENGTVPIVAKHGLVHMQIDVTTNNFSDCFCLRQLKSGILHDIEQALGAENVLEFETDLTALDGRTEYGKMMSKISLPTIDFYKANIALFDKYSDGRNWYLSTPWSTPATGCDDRAVLVTNRNRLYDTDSGNHYDIRPILYIKADALTTQN